MAKQTLTAFYDSREYANNAALQLKQAGVSDTDVKISPATSGTGDYVDPAGTEGKGFWASVEEMFGGSDDHSTYMEGLRRGGIMLVAHVDDTKVDEAIQILEQHGSVDLSERETTWRSEGWTGGTTVTGGGVADTGAGPLRSVTTATETKSVPVAAMSSATTLASTAAPGSTARTGTDDVLQVVEESLNVGKRAVNRGKVRVHSYVVETPVSESVSLRDETVSIDRRPVDRAVGVADLGVDAFKERTIEMEEIDEEAVVAKTTRVVEEIGIRKDASDRTQVVTDTVRSTKVDIEDGRKVGTRTGLISGFTTEIVDDMEVVGSDGQHVGVVDHLDGANIKLKKMDPASGGSHHLIPSSWVASIDSKVTLKTSAADAKSRWTAA
ncbi:DUF2171 domain-containing protein [Lichenifustis flavocetrariae]|uniref:DUF2171 domain-containing protein n=1 Tax=Lichenifustis flavocetrariae TaxID=2949735 RepID=A0AA41ZA05_9HYPH|nr:DUF2171 domain-containing protein [Lichenifustis flavocetrariae]MCW6512027.1 DUF2171 domain-containing protein [Lichenifustis flavocetrariae]